MVVILSSKTSVHLRTERLYIPEDGIIYNYRYENLRSCTGVCCLCIHEYPARLTDLPGLCR
jgi:hypothetical protein